jgi:Ca-activated chloride channel family protein
MVTLWIAIAVAAVVAGTEWLHVRRVTRIARLAFGARGKARAWTVAAAPARCVGAGVLAWGLLTLIQMDGGGRSAVKKREPDQHLLLVLDVSPSMYIKDAGPEGKQTRGERAREVLNSVLQRLDMSRTRVSIVVFYTTAKPVVVDTSDLNVVANILSDLPLEHAFKAGPTAMYSGVKEAAKLAQAGGWQPGSTTLVVVSDGDTLPDAAAPGTPSSVSDALILGVGSPNRTTTIAGHASRQDETSLKALAARVKGQYFDGNAHHLPTAVLAGLRMLATDASEPPPLRTMALVASGVGGTLVAGVGVALAAFGAPMRVSRRDATVAEKTRRGRVRAVRVHALEGALP